MKAKLTIPMDAIMKQIEEDAERWKTALVRGLMVVGEKCVNHARMLPSLSRADKGANRPHQPNYIDDTGNLRSSIGYVLVMDGELVAESNFDVVGKGRQGSEDGRSYAERLALNHPTGIALIVVAGMHYAEYVAAKGYDVLDSSELLAEQLVKKLMDELRQAQQ